MLAISVARQARLGCISFGIRKVMGAKVLGNAPRLCIVWIARDAEMEEKCTEGGSSYLLFSLGLRHVLDMLFYRIGLPLFTKAGS